MIEVRLVRPFTGALVEQAAFSWREIFGRQVALGLQITLGGCGVDCTRHGLVAPGLVKNSSNRFRSARQLNVKS